MALNVCVQEALQQLEENTAAKAQARAFDRYLTLRLSTLVRYVLLQMRNSMWFVIYGYFLAVVSVTFYPFQGGKNLSDILGVTFVIVLVIMGVLVTQVLRDACSSGLRIMNQAQAAFFRP